MKHKKLKLKIDLLYFFFRINVRIEHIKPSKCQQDFIQRVKHNDTKRREAKLTGEKLDLKRQPKPPRELKIVSLKKQKPQFLTPLPYEFVA